MAASKAKIHLETSYKKFQKFGNTYSVTVFGLMSHQTIEPENIKTVLSSKFKDYGLGDRIKAMGALLGRGIFTSDGEDWEHSRALVRPNFTKSQVADLDTFELHIQQLISKIPKDGSTVDLQTLFFQLTLDSATEFLLGESINSLTSTAGSPQQLFSQAFDAAQNELLHRLRLGPFVWFSRNRAFDKDCKVVHEYIDKFAKKAVQNKQLPNDKGQKEKYIFANELARATDDPDRIRSEMLNVLLAGRDTTAGLLSNTFHVLARRPDVWAKLMLEVDNLQGKRPDYETLRNMRYLKFILNESLRLYPSVPTNFRIANRNTVLPTGGGVDGKSPVFIPKGSMVNYSVYAMHRRKDLYGEDAEEYRPERWESLRVGWEYLPFNGGPRICVGQQFALTEAGYTIVRLVQEFDRIEARDSREWLEGLHLTLSSGNGVHVALNARA